MNRQGRGWPRLLPSTWLLPGGLLHWDLQHLRIDLLSCCEVVLHVNGGVNGLGHGEALLLTRVGDVEVGA
jgi:hypothetical protein